MGWIRCVRCKKLQRDFLARTFVLIEPVSMFSTKFHAETKQSQMHPKTTKRTEALVFDRMGWIGCVRCIKSRRDFVAQTFALLAPVHPVLHRVSCSYETIPNAPKHYETHQTHEFMVQWGGSGVSTVKNYNVTSWHELLY